jgi:SAM-dependent methyltransferase
MTQSVDYLRKLEQQIEQYRVVENIHDLPGIFHYWSGRYLAPPLIDLFGTAKPVRIFSNAFLECAGADKPRYLSVGAGDCTIEIAVAVELKREGLDFTIECAELSGPLLSRARKAADAAGVGSHLVLTQVDINQWRLEHQYAAVMAHHSLHHIVELEHVFDQIASHLAPSGQFVISDIIGRNGHMRWPEALSLIESIWATLPDSKKYNQQLKRLESEFVNWDCSDTGFEGVRAQDILPLLLSRFDFRKFMAFGNLTDVFVDRSFGHNFDPDSEADRAFIDRLHAVNELLIDLGVLKPTMVIATMSVKTQDGATTALDCYRDWEPEFCVRSPSSGTASDGALRTAAAPTGTDADAATIDAGDRRLHAKVRDLQERLGNECQARQRAERQIAQMHSSTSWRITAPLRWLKRPSIG